MLNCAVLILQALEEVKTVENQIFDLKKKIAECEGRLKQQQSLYESVRSDRNLYSKNLLESQDEISELKRKMKIMTHQIDQLKEEISAKEAALLKEHSVYEDVEQQKVRPCLASFCLCTFFFFFVFLFRRSNYLCFFLSLPPPFLLLHVPTLAGQAQGRARSHACTS